MRAERLITLVFCILAMICVAFLSMGVLGDAMLLTLGWVAGFLTAKLDSRFASRPPGKVL